MEWEQLQESLSTVRVERYLNECKKDHKKATQAYLDNVKVASSLMPMLHFLEVALRNRIHIQLKRHFKRDDWWQADELKDIGHELREKVEESKRKLTRRREAVSIDKIVAELSLGFWTTLLNSEFQMTLWGPIRKAFKNLPKDRKQRQAVSAPLNKVRDLRNRVFHHEPLLWLKDSSAESAHSLGLEVITWLDEDLATWLKSIDQFGQVWAEVEAKDGFVRQHKVKAS